HRQCGAREDAHPETLLGRRAQGGGEPHGARTQRRARGSASFQLRQLWPALLSVYSTSTPRSRRAAAASRSTSWSHSRVPTWRHHAPATGAERSRRRSTSQELRDRYGSNSSGVPRNAPESANTASLAAAAGSRSARLSASVADASAP